MIQQTFFHQLIANNTWGWTALRASATFGPLLFVAGMILIAYYRF